MVCPHLVVFWMWFALICSFQGSDEVFIGYGLDETGQDVLKVAPLSLRYTFPQEMDTLLHYNGFDIVEQYGDWDGSQLTDKSRMMISVCKKRE